jgi:hypothetical protein
MNESTGQGNGSGQVRVGPGRCTKAKENGRTGCHYDTIYPLIIEFIMLRRNGIERMTKALRPRREGDRDFQ